MAGDDTGTGTRVETDTPPPDDSAQIPTAHDAANAHEQHSHPAPEERKGLELIEIAGLALLAVVLVVGIYLVWHQIADRPVVVPKVTGMKRADAEQTLQAAGLSVGSVEKRFTDPDRVASGIVVEQDPPIGEQVSEGSAVALIVATPPVPVEVPDVVGMDREEGIDAFEHLGLEVQVSEQYSDEEPEDRILVQVPEAGRTITTIDPVAVVISLGGGPGGTEVPDVIGMLYTEAAPRLEAAGLEATTYFENIVDIPQGTVVAQQPKAGTRVKEGAHIALTISAFPTQPQ